MQRVEIEKLDLLTGKHRKLPLTNVGGE